MVQAYTTLRTKVLTTLQDAGSVIYTTAEIDNQFADGLRELAVIKPYVAVEKFTIESRYGTSTTTLADNLVDATKSQFLSTDVDKVIYNTTDKTWALITAYTSATTVTLSKDIMAAGESYKIFNKGCTAPNQVNIEKVTDYLWPVKAEYPIGDNPPSYRSIDGINGDILTIGLDGIINDTSVSNANKNVNVYFAKRHKVSQLTDFSGTLASSGLVSATTIAASSLQTAGTMEADQEFTIAGVMGNYVVNTDIAITATTAAITFHPPLESKANSTTVITFRQSTLTPQMESIVVDYVAGCTAISKATQPMQECITAIAVLATAATSLSNMTAIIAAATVDIQLQKGLTASGTAHITLASSSLTKIDAQIAAATVQMSAATALINTITTNMGAENDYMQAAAADINNGIGYIREGQAYFHLVTEDMAVSKSYYELVASDLNAANGYLRQGSGYLQKVQSQLQVANGSNPLYVWGLRKVEDAKRRLQRIDSTKTYNDYARD
jgi:hypothetical protein